MGVAKGIVRVQEIIKKIKEYFFPSELENALVCEEILSDKVCAALRKAAEKLKIGAKIVDDLIRKALEEGYRKASDIIKYIRDKMVSMSKIHCTDILSEKACAKIKELAGKVRVKFEKVIAFMKNVVAKGVTKAKEIIKKIHDFFFPGLEFELENEVKCEDVLADDVCAKLREAAKKLKLKVEEVNKLIEEAVAKGKEKAQEIIDYVHKRMVALSKVKCTDVLSESLCTKIKAFAEAFKIKYTKIIEVMKTAIAKGLDKISEIIDYIKKHFPHLGKELANEIICEEILSDKVCHDLREAAKKFKIKAEEIDKLVRETLDKKLRKAKDIIHYIRTKIVDMATNFKCTDALSEDVCAKIKEIAAKFKVDYQKVMKVIKDIIAKGITKAKEIIDEIKKHFFPQLEGELESEVKCEDVLADDVCAKLREAAKKLKLKVEEVNKLIEEAVAKGKEKAQEIIDYVHKRMVELATNFKCTDVLSKKMCDEVHDFAEKIKIAAKEVDEIIKKIVVAGVTKAEEIIKKIIEHFFPHH